MGLAVSGKTCSCLLGPSRSLAFFRKFTLNIVIGMLHGISFDICHLEGGEVDHVSSFLFLSLLHLHLLNFWSIVACG